MKRIFLSDIHKWPGKGVLSVMGPTGAGKTSTVLEWVKANYSHNLKHPLLVSVDAVAVYKGLDIGSAKPLGVEREDFSWLGLDLFHADQKVTAIEFVRLLKDPITQALNEQRPLILVGGSHFYERALVEGFGPGEASDPLFQRDLEKLPESELYERLLHQDPRWAQQIHPNDRYRLSRYLDLTERQALSFEAINEAKSLFPEGLWSETACLILGLDLSPQDAESRLKRRIEEMLNLGWVAEVKALLQADFSPQAPGLQSVGYKEIIDFLEGRLLPQELPEAILIRHRQLAKKQRTWLRGMLSKAALP